MEIGLKLNIAIKLGSFFYIQKGQMNFDVSSDPYKDLEKTIDV